MRIEDVTALARAGYTAQQIAALAQIELNQKTAPAPADAPAPVPAPAPAPAPSPQGKSWDDVYSVIAGMRQDLNAANLLAAQQNQPAAPTADQIIANIINPPKKEEK